LFCRSGGAADKKAKTKNDGNGAHYDSPLKAILLIYPLF
jgi:hypothetical protein